MAAARATVASEADLEYLRTIDTGFVHDALMLLGLNGSTARLSPVSPFGDKHVAGPVATVKFVPSNGIEKPLAHAYEVMNRAGKGSVIVMDCQGYPGNFLGGNMARIGSRVGLEAVVIDGGFRDTQVVRAHGPPVFTTQGACVAAGGGYEPKSFPMLLSEEDVTVTCDGVRVSPGDIMVGDDDGVVFIPSGAFEEVMANVREVEELERQMADNIAEGRPIEELLEIAGLKERWA